MRSNKPAIPNRWKWLHATRGLMEDGPDVRGSLSSLERFISVPTVHSQPTPHLVLKNITEYTQGRSHLHVLTVRTRATRNLISNFTYEYIQVKSHSPAPFAPISPLTAAMWTDISAHTLTEERSMDGLCPFFIVGGPGTNHKHYLKDCAKHLWKAFLVLVTFEVLYCTSVFTFQSLDVSVVVITNFA